MSVFFVHDAGRPNVTPLDRKFRVRDIPPTEELSSTQKIHPKQESNPEDFKRYMKTAGDAKAPPDEALSQAKQQAQQQAAAAYQTEKSLQSPFGRVKDIMSTPVLSIDQGKSLKDAWKIMAKYEISHLVILNEQLQYCGMLSEKKIPLMN